MQKAIWICLVIEANRVALANHLFLEAGRFFLGSIAPDNLSGARQACSGFHPLFKGRRHETSSKDCLGMLAGDSGIAHPVATRQSAGIRRYRYCIKKV